MLGIVKRGREERFRKQCSKEKLFYFCPCTSRTILFFTFSRFYSISLSAISIIIPVSVSVEALSLSPFQPVNSSSVGGSKEEGRGVSAVLSSVVLLLPQAFPRKKTSQEGGKIPERTEKRIFFSYSFFRETDRRECNANFYFREREREREREMVGKGGPGGSIGGGSKEGGGMERKLLFSISARSEKRGPEAKKGVDTGELGAFQKSPLSPAAVGRGGVGLSVGERAAEIK